MSDNVISVICVYNNADLFAALQRSVAAQTISCELIGIDNRQNAFSSAASALKAGVELASCDKILFVHQDIEFLVDDALECFSRAMDLEELALYGVAGVSTFTLEEQVVSAIKEGYDQHSYTTLKTDMQRAICLDECCFGCTKQVFREVDFDEVTCNGWHFYAADLCLQAFLLGIPSYILKCDVWHKSSGNFDASFWKQERGFERKYRRSFETIRTTCTWFPTGFPRYELYRLKRAYRRKQNRG